MEPSFLTAILARTRWSRAWDVGQETLQSVRHELDRPLEQKREPYGRDLVCIGVHLDPERAPDVARDHANPVLVQVEVGSQDVLDHVRALGVVPHGELLFGRIPVGEDGPRLKAHPGVPGEDICLLDDMVGLRTCRLDVAEIRVAPPGEVVAEALVDDGCGGVERGLGVGDGGQHLPVDLHELRRILRPGAALGDHRHHRLALPGRRLKGQRILRRRLEALEVGQHPDPGIVYLGQLASGHDRDHPRGRVRRFRVDRPDPGMRMGRTDERRVSCPLAELDVVDEGAAPLREARRVGARNGPADIGVRAVEEPAVRDEIGHDVPPSRARAISNASTIAS